MAVSTRYYFIETGYSTKALWPKIMKDFLVVKKRLYRGLDVTILADNIGIHHDAYVAQIALDAGVARCKGVPSYELEEERGAQEEVYQSQCHCRLQAVH